MPFVIKYNVYMTSMSIVLVITSAKARLGIIPIVAVICITPIYALARATRNNDDNIANWLNMKEY